MSEDEPRWRVGRHQPRNIYRNNREVAVAVGPDEEAAQVAEMLCAAANYVEAELFARLHGIPVDRE